jgi:hypothetical protein
VLFPQKKIFFEGRLSIWRVRNGMNQVAIRPRGVLVEDPSFHKRRKLTIEIEKGVRPDHQVIQNHHPKAAEAASKKTKVNIGHFKVG